MVREVKANRLAKALRGNEASRLESLAADFARELKLDFVRLVGVFRVSGGAGNRKGRKESS